MYRTVWLCLLVIFVGIQFGAPTHRPIRCLAAMENSGMAIRLPPPSRMPRAGMAVMVAVVFQSLMIAAVAALLNAGRPDIALTT